MTSCLARALLVALSLIVAASSAYAQASITGVVKDTSGAVLPGVTVEASSPALIEKTRSVVTDGSGQYRIVDLRPGVYTVTFSLPGFSTVQRSGLEVTGSFTAIMNADMRVGTLAETVTVTGETPVVDVQSTTRQRVVGKEIVDGIPNGRTQFTIANLIPGMTGFSDVGGSSALSPANTLSIHGGRSSDQRVTIDGLSTANAEGSGQWSAYLPNISATQEMTVDYAGIAAENSAGGVRINVIPREGGNTFRGVYFQSFANSSFQGSNLTQALIDAGLPVANSLKHQSDINPGYGGPIAKDRLWFYSAARFTNTANYAGGQYYNLNAGNPNVWTYAADTSRQAYSASIARSYNTRLTWQLNSRNKVTLFYDDQYKCNGCPPGGANTSPEAGAPLAYPFGRFATVNYSSPLSSRLLLEAGAAQHGENWQYRDRWPDGPSYRSLIGVTEQSSGLAYRGGQPAGGANFLGVYAESSTSIWQFRASLSYITGAHAFKVGINDQWLRRDVYVDDNDAHMNFRLNNGLPNQIAMRASPLVVKSNMPYDSGIYAQDKWTVQRFTLNMGVRFDWLNIYFPEQHLGPAYFIPTRDMSFPKTDWVAWKDVTPRLGAAYDLFGNGKTALKVTLNKYMLAGGVQGTLGDASNPVNRMANAVTRAWTDANGNFTPDCDITNPVQQDLRGSGRDFCGAMSNASFGKPIVTTNVDPDILNGWGKRGYNWEFSTGIQHELLPRTSLDVSYFRRWYGNFSVADNLATRPTDYSPFSITAPADPRLPDRGGYVISGLYNLNPDKVGLVDTFRTFSSNYGEQIERWNGVDVGLNLRLQQGVQLQGGFSTGRTTTDNCDLAANLDNPSQRFCHQELLATQVKFFGLYTVPRIDVQVAGSVQNTPGTMISANYNAPNALVQPSLGRPLSGGAPNVTVNLIEPGTMYGDRVTQLDLRFSKILRFGRARASANLDLYNALNRSTVTSLNPNFATWLRPQGITTARFAKVSVQLDF